MSNVLSEQDKKNVLMLAYKHMLLANKKLNNQFTNIDIPNVQSRILGKFTIIYIDPIVIIKPTEKCWGINYKLELWVSDSNILYNFVKESVANFSQINEKTKVLPFIPKQENTDVSIMMSKIKNDFNINYWIAEIKKEAIVCLNKKGVAPFSK